MKKILHFEFRQTPSIHHCPTSQVVFQVPQWQALVSISGATVSSHASQKINKKNKFTGIVFNVFFGFVFEKIRTRWSYYSVKGGSIFVFPKFAKMTHMQTNSICVQSAHFYQINTLIRLIQAFLFSIWKFSKNTGRCINGFIKIFFRKNFSKTFVASFFSEKMNNINLNWI